MVFFPVDETVGVGVVFPTNGDVYVLYVPVQGDEVVAADGVVPFRVVGVGLADAGVAVSADTSTAAVVAISGAASAIWYAAARALEQKSAAWGWLLGVPKPPTY